MIDVYTDMMFVCLVLIMAQFATEHNYFFMILTIILIAITFFHSKEMKQLKRDIVKE